MVRRKQLLVGLLVAAVAASGANAQDTSDAVSDAASAAGVSSSSSATEAAPTVLGLIVKIPKVIHKLKKKFCKCCIGQMFGAMLKPLTLMSGGCIKCCANEPDAEDLKQAGAAGACALITKDTLEAGDRVAAVLCLSTVDCNYWPEAEKTLILALRTDKNPGVRLAAAQVLGKGCCCTPKTIAALRMTVTGSTQDGNPAESSARVRAAALASLNHCVTTMPAAPTPSNALLPPERPRPAPPAASAGTPRKPAARPAPKPPAKPAPGANAGLGTPNPRLVNAPVAIDAVDPRAGTITVFEETTQAPASRAGATVSDGPEAVVLSELDPIANEVVPLAPVGNDASIVLDAAPIDSDSVAPEFVEAPARIPPRGDRSLFGIFRAAKRSAKPVDRDADTKPEGRRRRRFFWSR